MAKYIDAEKLRALLETRYNTLKIGQHSPFRNGKIETLRETIDLINSLQQEQMEETYCPRSEKWKEVEETARQEYENGRKDCKEQMLKEAVEGTYDSYPAAVYLDIPIPQLKHGDKVHIIILKEDKNETQ